jgi:hypothetical protein
MVVDLHHRQHVSPGSAPEEREQAASDRGGWHRQILVAPALRETEQKQSEKSMMQVGHGNRPSCCSSRTAARSGAAGESGQGFSIAGVAKDAA